MTFLLDTHIFLWFVNDDPRLSNALKDLIEDENNFSYLSIASLWEMSIKRRFKSEVHHLKSLTEESSSVKVGY